MNFENNIEDGNEIDDSMKVINQLTAINRLLYRKSMIGL